MTYQYVYFDTNCNNLVNVSYLILFIQFSLICYLVVSNEVLHLLCGTNSFIEFKYLTGNNKLKMQNDNAHLPNSRILISIF